MAQEIASLAVDRLILEIGLEDLANASPMTIEDRTIDEVDRVQVRDDCWGNDKPGHAPDFQSIKSNSNSFPDH